MTFQIINTTTKQPINLAEFDSKYCTITGTPELSKEFGLWFHWLEGGLTLMRILLTRLKIP